MMSRRLSLLLCVSLVVSLLTTPLAASENFDDVPDDHLFSADIDWMAETGVTRGCNPPENTRFCPGDFVTRGQMAAFLVRALELPTSDRSFEDTAGHIFEFSIASLAEAGITRGCNPPENDRFCPDEFVTRGQMAAFLVRALGLDEGDRVFEDTEGHLFQSDVARLAEAGITRGCNPPENSLFCPDQFVTRGQMAAFLHRALPDLGSGIEPLAIVTTSLPDFVVGLSYHADLDATGGVPPYTWTGSGLPPGLSVDADGFVSGVPTEDGVFESDITVTDSAGTSVSTEIEMTVGISVPRITTEALPSQNVFSLYDFTPAVSGGVPPYNWEIEGLPDELTFDPATGRIFSDPSDPLVTNTEDKTLTVTVVDSLGHFDMVEFQLGVVGAAAAGASEGHSCALDTEGRAWCWGSNDFGELGVDTAGQESRVPVPVSGDHVFEEIAVGRDATCARESGGQVWCWGRNDRGQLGTPDVVSSTSLPVPVSGEHTFDAITAGWDHMCALDTDGAAWCWGFNGAGQLGNGEDDAAFPAPQAVVDDLVDSFASISAGGSTTCAVDGDGKAWCWGADQLGQLGDGEGNSTRNEPGPVVDDEVDPLTTVSVGHATVCGLDTGGDVWCWGFNSRGQASAPPTVLPVWVPTELESAPTFDTVTSGQPVVCALESDGSTWCWGGNSEGMMGIGEEPSTDDTHTPTEIAGLHLQSIEAGSIHVCAVDTDGLPWCWGTNADGELGNGVDSEFETSPGRVVPG